MATSADINTTGYGVPYVLLSVVAEISSVIIYQTGTWGTATGDFVWTDKTVNRIRLTQNKTNILLNGSGGAGFSTLYAPGDTVLIVTDAGQAVFPNSPSRGGGFINFSGGDAASLAIVNAIATGTRFGFAIAPLSGGDDGMSGYYNMSTNRDKLTILQWITDASVTVKRINAAGSAYETVSGNAATTWLATVDIAMVFIDAASSTKVIYFQDYTT